MVECESITLSNGKTYDLLKKKEINSKTYYLAELEGINDLDKDNIFLELVVKDGKEFMKIVTDDNLIKELLIVFTADFIKYTEKIGGNE